jgi:hypothetical protein
MSLIVTRGGATRYTHGRLRRRLDDLASVQRSIGSLTCGNVDNWVHCYQLPMAGGHRHWGGDRSPVTTRARHPFAFAVHPPLAGMGGHQVAGRRAQLRQLVEFVGVIGARPRRPGAPDDWASSGWAAWPVRLSHAHQFRRRQPGPWFASMTCSMCCQLPSFAICWPGRIGSQQTGHSDSRRAFMTRVALVLPAAIMLILLG